MTQDGVTTNPCGAPGGARAQAERVLATSDCEHCRPGLISQPANAVSSLAYVVAGAAMLRSASGRVADVDRPLDLARGAAVVAVGLGSVAYHGPGGRLGKWTHDAALVSMLLLAELRVARALRPSTVVPLAALAAVPAVAALVTHPRTTDPSQAIIGAATVSGQIARTVRARRTGEPVHRLSTAAIFGVAGLCHALGRTGMPGCRPESLLQPHAAWHVLSAIALWRESVDLDRPEPGPNPARTRPEPVLHRKRVAGGRKRSEERLSTVGLLPPGVPGRLRAAHRGDHDGTA